LLGGNIGSLESLGHALTYEIIGETQLSVSFQQVPGAAEADSPTWRQEYLPVKGHVEVG